jgi:hypothetical protein
MSMHDLSLSVAEALLRSQRPRDHSPSAVREGTHAVIAVSREVGALGETVAHEVGRRLGCPTYEREIVEKIAEELRQPASALEPLDERPTFWIEDWLGGMTGQHTLVAMDTYVKYLFATVHGIAELGRSVIVGRGATLILPKERTLRVRLIAERADRIKTIERVRHLSAHEAERWLERTEHERDTFMRRSFSIEPTDPHLYDLVLNTSRLPVAECADLICHEFARFEARTGQSAA